jgi:hypothetical protein
MRDADHSDLFMVIEFQAMNVTIDFPAWSVVSAHSQPGKVMHSFMKFSWHWLTPSPLQMTWLSVFKLRITTLASSLVEHRLPVAPEGTNDVSDALPA